MFDLFKSTKYYFLSDILVTDCIDILSTHLNRPSGLKKWLDKNNEISGHISENRFEIFKKVDGYQSIIPIWNGKFSQVHKGTLIEVSPSLSIFGKTAAVFMFYGLIMILLSVSSFTIIDIIKEKNSFSVIYLSICILLFIGLVMGIGLAKIVNSKEERFFINFFMEKFNAKKIETPDSSPL